MPSNAGNIMRTALAANARVHVIGPISFSLDEKAFRRAGMDYLRDVDVVYYSSYEEFEKIYGDRKIYYVTRYGLRNYAGVDYGGPAEDTWLMFGRESSGIAKDILRKHREMTIRIPMRSDARSLNLSNAVAIVLYEVLRQKGFPGLASFEMIKKDVI